MKTLALLLFVTSFQAFSQDIFLYDDYHMIDEGPKCQRETCIDIDGAGYGFYEYEDREGNKFLKLNTDSTLLDMNLSRGCFTGDKGEAVKIILGLAGNTNADYGNGGHAYIEKENILHTTNDSIVIEFEYYSDYMNGLQKITESIFRCK